MLRYRNYALVDPDLDQRKRIADIIRDFNGSIFHEVQLNRIVSSNFGTELYYLVDKPGKINCFTPVHVSKGRFGARRYTCNPLGDIPYAGFVGGAEIDLNDFKLGILESLKYSGFPYVPDYVHTPESSSYGETNMVDLSMEEDEIFQKFSSAKRRNVRKAIKAGIEIKKFFTDDGLIQFWPILEKLHDSLGYDRFTFNYYKEFIDFYGKDKKAFVLLAFKEDRPISGLLILGNTNYMHFYKGASAYDVKSQGQGELLHWEAIKTSKALGAKYYDLCNLNKKELPAIYKFKTGISQNIIKYPKYTNNRIGYKVLNRANKVGN